MAKAAPFTPIFIANIKIGSSIIFDTAPIKTDNIKYIIHIQESDCEIIVAKAAPFTPIFIANIKIGSSIIFDTAPIKTDNIPIFANP